MVFQSIPCETLGEITAPMITDVAESDEVRVWESI